MGMGVTNFHLNLILLNSDKCSDKKLIKKDPKVCDVLAYGRTLPPLRITENLDKI